MRRESIVGIVVAVVAVVLVGIPIVLFSFGEDLFGSDRGTIDDYNRETLESCDVPDDLTLVRIYVASVEDLSGNRYRGMGFVYAAPSKAPELAAVLGVDVGYESVLSESHACRFGNRPPAWVVDAETAGSPDDADDTPFWGGPDAEIELERPIPPGTRSLVRLRLALVERDGVVG
jgi:hypothetical protein